MTVQDELHRLIDGLDDIDAEEVLDHLRALLHDPDELSEEELALVRAGEAQIARGEFVTLDEIRRGVTA